MPGGDSDGWASVSIKKDLRHKLRVKKAKEGLITT